MKIVEYKKAPGRKIVKRMSLQTKSTLLSVVSLIVFVYGIIVLAKAVWLESTNEVFNRWFLLGIYAIALVVGGMIMYGNALQMRVRVDTRKEMRRFFRKNRRELAYRKEAAAKKQKPKEEKSHKEKEKENPAKSI